MEEESDLEITVPGGALLRVLLWLGLEQDQAEWARAVPSSELSVFAETYENEVCVYYGKSIKIFTYFRLSL